MTRSSIPQRFLILALSALALALSACGGTKKESPPPTLITSLDQLATQAALQRAGTPSSPTPSPMATPTSTAAPTVTPPAAPLPTFTLTSSPSATPSLAPTAAVLPTETPQPDGIALTGTAEAGVLPYTQTAVAVMGMTQTAAALVSPTSMPTIPLTAPPEPAGPLQVIYYTNRNGNDDIYLLMPDGTQRPLIATSANEREPSCSPDGKSVVFASDASGSFQLYLLSIGQPAPVQLTNTTGMNFAPVFSPDGFKIAFVSTQNQGIPTIWEINADGSNPQEITTELGRDTSPSWGSDGRQLLFSSDQTGPWNMFLTILGEDVEGEFPVMPPELDQRNQLWPFFDSQGEQIVYTAWDDLSDPQTSDIYLIDFEATQPRAIRQGPGADIAWSWADDTHLLASVGGPGDVQIALVDVNTGQAERLTNAGTFSGGARSCAIPSDLLPPEPALPPSPMPTFTPTFTPLPSATPTAAPSPTPTEMVFSPELMAAAGQKHIVQPGDTLMGLGYRYGVNWTTLVSLNNLSNPNILTIGTQLTIPLIQYAPPMHGGYREWGADEAVRPGVRKEIVVDLSEQKVRAYEDGRLVREVLVSTGLPGSPTVQGEYSIYDKIEAQTMSGPGYYLPGVPYVMYFYQGYGLHGTYWHNNFGHPMSHGCVNLPTPDAKWFYDWAEIGTPVLVQQ